MSEFEGEVASDARLDHIAECTRCPLFAVVQTGTGRGADVPGATGPLVGPLRREVTEAGEELGQCVLVVLGELPVQGPIVHSLGEQLGDIAVGVRLGLAVGDGTVVQRGVAVVVDQGVGVLVAERQQFDPELPAVVDGDVVLGDSRGAHVVEVARREVAGLGLAVQVGLGHAFSCGPHAAAGAAAGLENLDLVPALLQFIGADQAGWSSAEDQHLRGLAVDLVDQVPGADRGEGLTCRVGVGDRGRHPEGGHGTVCCSGPGEDSESGEEGPPGEAVPFQDLLLEVRVSE